MSALAWPSGAEAKANRQPFCVIHDHDAWAPSLGGPWPLCATASAVHAERTDNTVTETTVTRRACQLRRCLCAAWCLANAQALLLSCERADSSTVVQHRRPARHSGAPFLHTAYVHTMCGERDELGLTSGVAQGRLSVQSALRLRCYRATCAYFQRPEARNHFVGAFDRRARTRKRARGCSRGAKAATGEARKREDARRRVKASLKPG